jgi:Zn-dependent oligopeptidase
VHDEATGDLIGHFYMDLHPREGKYGHAAIFHLLKRNGAQAAVDCMLCNLPAPSEDGTPALLKHMNVVTFFHEFGHIMHGLCAVGDGNSTRLAKCPRDFVEAPSQMLENWCWQPAILQRLSKHHTTGEPLPDTLLKSLVAAKNVNEGLGMMRQLYLGQLDLTIHGTDVPNTEGELQAVVDKLHLEVSLLANPPGVNMLRNFGHLMNQYSAAYYGYLWAEVLSADMFASRFEADCLSKEVRDGILLTSAVVLLFRGMIGAYVVLLLSARACTCMDHNTIQLLTFLNSLHSA